MTRSIERKWAQITEWIKDHPDDGHPHYWGGGNETDCEECNMDHPMTDLHLSLLDEEREFLSI